MSLVIQSVSPGIAGGTPDQSGREISLPGPHSVLDCHQEVTGLEIFLFRVGDCKIPVAVLFPPCWGPKQVPTSLPTFCYLSLSFQLPPEFMMVC